ncbi:MAG: hypothetical protein ACI8PQ_002733, partial [Planctomycetota bacterium]
TPRATVNGLHHPSSGHAAEDRVGWKSVVDQENGSGGGLRGRRRLYPPDGGPLDDPEALPYGGGARTRNLP